MTSLLETPAHFTALLVRNHDMVHARTCYRVSGVKVNPWLWAEDKTAAQVEEAKVNGLKFCRSCNPIAVVQQRDNAHANPVAV